MLDQHGFHWLGIADIAMVFSVFLDNKATRQLSQSRDALTTGLGEVWEVSLSLGLGLWNMRQESDLDAL